MSQHCGKCHYAVEVCICQPQLHDFSKILEGDGSPSPAPGTITPVGRVFKGGAYRDQDETKLDFVKGLSPEVLERYLEYLSSTRLQSNGNMRDWDNWKSGIPKEVYLSSLYRHVHAVWKNFKKGDLEEELCAVIFNSMGLLFEILKEKGDTNDS